MTTLTERETKALEAISRAVRQVSDRLPLATPQSVANMPNIVLDIDAKRAIGREVAEALARNGHAKAHAGRYVLS